MVSTYWSADAIFEQILIVSDQYVHLYVLVFLYVLVSDIRRPCTADQPPKQLRAADYDIRFAGATDTDTESLLTYIIRHD